MPARIGVVTSADGAVWHDIQNVLRRRYPLVELILSPTLVQGDGAPEGIVRALEALQLDGRAQVIIVARGGGSADDLASFNDERVVRAVFASSVPIVSGVGHETDWTLTDDVADLRAPTPSAAAELCSPSVVDLGLRLIELRRDMRRTIDQELRSAMTTAANRAADLDRLSPFATLKRDRDRLTVAITKLDNRVSIKLKTDSDRVSVVHGLLSRSISDKMLALRHRLELDEARLTGIDPVQVIRRGYAFVERIPESSPVTGAEQLSAGNRVRLHFADGGAEAGIDAVYPGGALHDRV
jgi:exodeoxyribonuclease VII large subunit